MLSKAQSKHISALRTKKYRTEHAQFIVEGKKSVGELLKSNFEIEHIYYTVENKELPYLLAHVTKTEINAIDFGKISQQKNPEGVLAIVNIPKPTLFEWNNASYIALDSIRDPGNLGTIIRLADWFGTTLICSTDCVELYNPKVVQASMGSLFHINIHYVDLTKELKNTSLPKYAATLDGQSIYVNKYEKHAVLIIGNEANGISEQVLQLATDKITLPNKGNAESLNAAMACGILSAMLFK